MISIVIDKIQKLDNATNEAYKRLRTNVQLCGSDVKVIAITSTFPGEGKSSVSFSLAMSIAETGKRVMFIDADLRKSVFVSRYRVNKSVKGLVHYLTGMNTFEEVACRTNIEGLDMMFAGPVPPNPSELLGGKNFKTLLSNLRGKYDYILIDTAPVGSVIDAAIIAQECDGAIMVVASGEVGKKYVINTKEQLDKCGCKILGAVLNKVDFATNSYYGKYYGKYYGHDNSKKF